MTVSRDDLLRCLQEAKKPLMAAVNNASRARRSARPVRVVRRIRNADGDIEEQIEEVDEEPVEEEVDETVGVGDTVVIQPDQEITGEIVEVVEEAPSDEVVEEVEEEEEPVQNARRRYRRVKNARILRNSAGGCDVLVPIETPQKPVYRTKNVRRYRTRTVTRNAGIPVDGTYAKTVSTPDVASWATVANKARRYDELLLNASIEQSIDDALKKALNKNGITNNGCKGRCTTNRRSNVLRFDRYRQVRNEDGTVSIEIDMTDARPADTCGIPSDAADDVDVVVDGRPIDNARAARNRRIANARRIAAVRRIRNLRQNGQSVVYNESEVQETSGLDVPSTFPTAE